MARNPQKNYVVRWVEKGPHSRGCADLEEAEFVAQSLNLAGATCVRIEWKGEEAAA